MSTPKRKVAVVTGASRGIGAAAALALAEVSAKQAFHKMTGALHLAFSEQGIYAYNLFPGWVITESQKASSDLAGFDSQYKPSSPEVFAQACRWLAESCEEAKKLSGRVVSGPKICNDLGLA